MTYPPLFALWLWLASAPGTLTLLEEYPTMQACQDAKRLEGRRYKATGGATYMCLAIHPPIPSTNDMLETR